ncbi:HYR domain-containing protein [Geobacter sp. DSM 9736]|uniref:HYR domain-containing protein n=1 Tax=Geobacter sp. DSM 9736 TaxID=1277350 RepID=UPI000B5013E7|nr:HYR domain-containing protein [Geobacter sp. DSM 9736]SNB47923.1 HYR domain-containing protein [Geobacter sp. DSM 9736]
MMLRKWISLVLFAAASHLLAGAPCAEVFLKGNYIEVGVHNSGSFGTSTSPPASFHSYGRRLGFIADPAKDGWSVGNPPATGDFFVPGSPEEGWSVQWTDALGEKNLFHNYGLMSQVQVPVTSLAETSSGDTKSALWVGTANGREGKLDVTQNVSFNVNDLFFTMNVVFTNTGTSTLHALKYMRNVDPDQEVELPYGDFTTRNWVEAQPPRSGVPGKSGLPARPDGNTSSALVLAQGLRYGFTLGLGAIDPRAVVATQGFSNRDIDRILDNPAQPTPSAPVVYDQAIVLAFDLGDLAPGQSKSVTYAYILDRSDLDRALGNLAAVTILQPTGTVSGSSVLFQATTDRIAQTTKMGFYVNGVEVGSDDTPNAGGVFESSFDSTQFANGTITLKVVATFADGRTVEKTSTGAVDNLGPPVSFLKPLPAGVFSGTGIPVEISVDPNHAPARVSFFRESAGGSLFLGEDSSAPFTSAFGVTDLPEGATVVVKAVATDALGRTTTIAVSGTSYRNAPPQANPGVSQTYECSGPLTAVTLDGSGSLDPDGDTLSYSWSGPFGTATGSPVLTMLARGIHAITLTVSDGKATDTASVTVSISDTVSPTVIADPAVTIEATGPTGAPYSLPVTATDVCGLDRMVVTPSLSVYPMGTTVVTATAFDFAGGSTSVTSSVTVVDTTAPAVTPPANVTVEAADPQTAVAIGTATAADAVGVVSLTNNAPSTFPLGTTTIIWTATDAAGNEGTATQTVTVTDSTAPVVIPPTNVNVEATGPQTTVDIGSATAADAVGVTSLTSNAPAEFPIGTTTVLWTATDAAGNRGTATQTVTVTDSTAPVVIPPTNLNVEATGPQTTVAIGTATAADAVGVTSLTSNAPGEFPIGTTTVLWTATDAAGNRGTATQTVSVTDTTPPVLAGLDGRVVEATSASGAIVAFNVTARDLVTENPHVTCTPASGSVFAIGTTTVTCKASDGSGNSATGSFSIKVQDTTPPVLNVPAAIWVPLNTPVSAPVVQAFLGAASATDNVDSDTTVTYTVPDLTAVGPKIVTFTSTDDFGNSTSASATIWVDYVFAGFLPPVNLGKPFKAGSTVPVKFQLTDAGGNPVTSATAKFLLQKYAGSEPVGDPIEVTSTSGADTGNYFRISDGIYIYNLNTSLLERGTYQIQVMLDGGTVKATWLAITK